MLLVTAIKLSEYFNVLHPTLVMRIISIRIRRISSCDVMFGLH